MKLRIVLAPKKEAATMGVEGTVVRKPAIVAALAPKSVLLIKCFPGNARGLLDILAASLRNATTEPVNVIPPDIHQSAYIEANRPSCAIHIPMTTPR
jgi:hypothetical protein